jgi:PAS domain S-box-containing protein
MNPRPPESRRTISSVLRALLTILLFAATFCVVQRLTFALRVPSYERTAFWTPGALLFAALLLAPPRRWWMYFVGLCLGVFAAFFDNSSVPLAMAMLAAVVFFPGLALALWTVRRFTTAPPFGNPTSLVVFVVLALVLVPLLVAVPVHLGLLVSGAEDAWEVVLRSWLAGALGTLIATPALTLTLADGTAWLRAGSWPRYVEIASLAVGLAVTGFFCFLGPAGAATSPALLYVPLPLILWAALRFELAGVSWALLVLAVQSTWGPVHGRGPFASLAPAGSVLQLQLFLLTISLPLMFLATVIRERRQASLALSETQQEVRQEMTERKRTEERFRLVVESVPNAIVMVNAEGNIVLINSQCEKCFGYRREELLGRPIEILVPERFRLEHPGHRTAFFASPPAWPRGAGRDLVAQRMDGSEFPVEVGLTPLRTSAGLLVLCTIVDITARKQAEEARRELAHAGRLALMGELTASIAHEINQPLGAILTNAVAAEMMLEASAPALDQVRDILADIRKDDQRASEVIRRLRTLLSNRQMEIQPVDVNEVSSDVVLLVRAEARRRGITVASEPAADLPHVRGDKVHLQQVLLNLVLNGMDAMGDMPGERRLTLRTGVKEHGSVEIAVTDTGHGILPDRFPRLFDPFFSTKKDGLGLGLSIARSLVEAHGGRIWAENNPEGGATFRFALPANAERPGRDSPRLEKPLVETSV